MGTMIDESDTRIKHVLMGDKNLESAHDLCKWN